MKFSTTISPSKYCLSLLRVHDFNRYIASLFAPASKRAAFVAIWAFYNEMARLAAQVKQPLMGEIRLRWWCDEIEKIDLSNCYHQDKTQNPLLFALIQAIYQFDLPKQSFIAACEAHMRWLYAPNLSGGQEFEFYSRESTAVFFQLACQILSPDYTDSVGKICFYAGQLETLWRHRHDSPNPNFSLLQESYRTFIHEANQVSRPLRPAFSSLAGLYAPIQSRNFIDPSPLRRLWLISRASLSGYFCGL